METKELVPGWSLWIFGTVITAICPFLSALFAYISGDFDGNYLDYIGLSDTLAFLFSIAVNCFFLSIDRRKRINIHFKRVVFWVSFLSGFFTGTWYFYAVGSKNETKEVWLFEILLCTCVLNMVLGTVVEYKADANRGLEDGK